MRNDKVTFLDITVIFLSVYVLSALLVDTFFKLSPETSRLLSVIDDLLCVIFLYDFGVRFIKAENKMKFMKWGWIDFISSIPALSYLQYGRIFRLFRLLRILRAFRSFKYLTAHLLKRRKQGTFALVALIALLMIVFGSIAILQVENTPEGNIKTAGDALWWAFVTITTVGYGDKYPVTPEGRIIAAFLMVTGVGLFGTFTGYVAAWFMGDKQEKEKNE